MLASKPIAVVANKRDLVEVRASLPTVSLGAKQLVVLPSVGPSRCLAAKPPLHRRH